MNILSSGGTLNSIKNENTYYHPLFEFLIINKYETLSQLKEYDIDDFLYLVEVAGAAEYQKMLSINNQIKSRK